MRALATIIALAACGGRAPAPPVPEPVPIEVASTEPSLYELGITLRDRSGAHIGLDHAKGSPVLVSMFYASCSVACPALIADIERTLAEIGRADVRVLLVSFDAARDTPAALSELTHRLDARWIIASADEPSARELAAVLGYKYRRLDNGEFFHSATIVALDEAGRPIARSEGFGQRAPLVSALITR